MKFGLLLLFEYEEDFQNSLKKQLELIKLYDDFIDTIWVTEHHYNPLRINSTPLMLLNHLATHTNKNLGVATLLLGLYDPVYISENISMLGNLTNRKLFIGIAKGGRSEVKNSHLNLNEKLARKNLIKKYKVVKPLLDNKTISFKKKEFFISPKVTNKIEFSVASLHDKLIKFAAQNDLPLMAGHKWSIKKIEDLICTYQSFHKKNQKPKIILSRMFCPTNDKQNIISSIKEKMQKQKELVKKFNKNHETKILDETIFDESLIGSPKEIKEKIEFFKNLGIEEIILRPISEQINLKDIKATIEIKKEEIL